jgi:hypothetical protein
MRGLNFVLEDLDIYLLSNFSLGKFSSATITGVEIAAPVVTFP